MSNRKPYPSDVPDEVVDSLVSWALKHIPANVVARNVDGGKLAGAAPDFREPNLLLSCVNKGKKDGWSVTVAALPVSD